MERGDNVHFLRLEVNVCYHNGNGLSGVGLDGKVGSFSFVCMARGSGVIFICINSCMARGDLLLLLCVRFCTWRIHSPGSITPPRQPGMSVFVRATTVGRQLVLLAL